MTIEALTSQEMLILVIGTVIVVMIIGLLFKTFIKLAIVAAMCILVFGVGFGWLPQKMEELRNGTTTPGEIFNELMPSNEVVENAGNTYNQVYNTVTDPVLQQSIWDTAISLFNKVLAMFAPEPVDNTVVDNTIVDNTVIDNTTNTVDNTTNTTNP